MPFKITYIQVLLAIGGLIIGFFINYYVNKLTNEKLFAQIKAEIDAIKQKRQISRLTEPEANRLMQLEGASEILRK